MLLDVRSVSFEAMREKLAEAAVKDPLSEVTRKERRLRPLRQFEDNRFGAHAPDD
jgi:hypothetical protein